MILNIEELTKLIQESTTMYERLKNNSIDIDSKKLVKKRNSLVEQWCKVVAQGNRDKFEKRLALDNIDPTRVPHLLHSTDTVDIQNLPNWLQTLNEVIKYTKLFSNQFINNQYRFLELQNLIPFEEIYVPFICVARQQLIERTGSKYSLLSSKSHANLERSLLKRLCFVASQSLELEFSLFKVYEGSVIFYIYEKNHNNYSNFIYKKFINKLLKTNLSLLFKEYSVLAKLMAITTNMWIDAAEEFIIRLALDWSIIQSTFQTSSQLGQVASLKCDLSDFHKGGRSVIQITFASGLNIIYKPRNTGIEENYFKLLKWFNMHGFVSPFKLLKVINKSTYGWIEFVEYLPCENEQEIKQYYERLGNLLCLLYVLQATDCHLENIIASGEHPILIDTETLLHQRILEDKTHTLKTESTLDQQHENSVLRTAMLPLRNFQDSKQDFDFSGVGGFCEQQTSYKILKWNCVNTDNMKSSYEYGNILPQKNLPLLNSKAMPPNNYINEFVNGFRQMYNFLINHKKTILNLDSPLLEIASQQNRFIFRNTQLYYSILQKSLNPKFLRNGVDRSIQLDILSRGLLDSKKNLLWSLLKAEVNALEQIDIPLFNSHPNSNSLIINHNDELEDCFKKTSWKHLLVCLENLNDEDCEKQIYLIRKAFL
jgi:type 2 lantibiotic biosynthesis protein LanM